MKDVFEFIINIRTIVYFYGFNKKNMNKSSNAAYYNS